MSVLIKGVDMPGSCWSCPCWGAEYDECDVTGKSPDGLDGMDRRLYDCPLVELPDHGDLIDKDELIKHEVYMPMDGGNLPLVYVSYVKGAKVVIPAERSEECRTQTK